MSKFNVDSRWTRELKDNEERDRLVNNIAAAKPVLDKLRELILELEKGKALPDYDSPAWPYWRADRDGYSRGLGDVLKLIPELKE